MEKVQNLQENICPSNWFFVEEFMSIAQAFEKEKQIQGWSRAKKKALIEGNFDKLVLLSKNYSQFGKQE